MFFAYVIFTENEQLRWLTDVSNKIVVRQIRNLKFGVEIWDTKFDEEKTQNAQIETHIYIYISLLLDSSFY